MIRFFISMPLNCHQDLYSTSAKQRSGKSKIWRVKILIFCHTDVQLSLRQHMCCGAQDTTIRVAL